ncbi:MAG: hypothetical protein A2846_01515 [Candidatus Doudnabacteria bacterium RIFCSPHIGHO2_01_FULL_49_9]|nr:MAG: hypothetical protein A2846_01515 [Candidatus Doudnabacteria bacterium RIFCSPHIGHO2_01_FULL_49_9]
MASLGVIVYIVALALPRIEVPAPREGHPLSKVISSLPLKKIDEAIASYKAKTLRRFRLIIMKLDNLISKSLHKDKDKPRL